MTQIGFKFFYNLTLNFQNCGLFKFLRERQFLSERPFLKIPIAQNLSVTEQFKTCILNPFDLYFK